MSDEEWVRVADRLPPSGQDVETKIEDHLGIRNIQTLRRSGNLWFAGSMYVYYRPTHWRMP